MLGKIWGNGHNKMVSEIARYRTLCIVWSTFCKNKYMCVYVKTTRNYIKRKIVVTLRWWNAFGKCVFFCFADFISVVVFKIAVI